MHTALDLWKPARIAMVARNWSAHVAMEKRAGGAQAVPEKSKLSAKVAVEKAELFVRPVAAMVFEVVQSAPEKAMFPAAIAVALESGLILSG
jgi:hypothetical protein